MAVQWKLGKNHFKGDANLCYQEITSLWDSFTPEDIVEYATDSNPELHKCFLWDDQEAAHRYRLTQAREIIRSIVVISEKKDESSDSIMMRAIVSTNNNDTTYEPITVTIRNEDSYQKLLNEAMRELETFRQKYSIIKELENIFEDIDLLIA